MQMFIVHLFNNYSAQIYICNKSQCLHISPSTACHTHCIAVNQDQFQFIFTLRIIQTCIRYLAIFQDLGYYYQEYGSIYLSIYLSIYISIYIYLFSYLSIHHRQYSRYIHIYEYIYIIFYFKRCQRFRLATVRKPNLSTVSLRALDRD